MEWGGVGVEGSREWIRSYDDGPMMGFGGWTLQRRCGFGGFEEGEFMVQWRLGFHDGVQWGRLIRANSDWPVSLRAVFVCLPSVGYIYPAAFDPNGS